MSSRSCRGRGRSHCSRRPVEPGHVRAPWQVALPGLSFIRAMELTQASTALSIVAPGGAAVGAAGAYGMLRRWGFPARDFTRAVTLTGLWNQFLNLSFPIIAVFLLTITGAQTAALATVAFIGVAVLGVVLATFVVVLVSNRLANDLGDLVARLANWSLGKVSRGPVKWGGASFERFRSDAGDFLPRRWHLLTRSSRCFAPGSWVHARATPIARLSIWGRWCKSCPWPWPGRVTIFQTRP